MLRKRCIETSDFECSPINELCKDYAINTLGVDPGNLFGYCPFTTVTPQAEGPLFVQLRCYSGEQVEATLDTVGQDFKGTPVSIVESSSGT